MLHGKAAAGMRLALTDAKRRVALIGSTEC